MNLISKVVSNFLIVTVKVYQWIISPFSIASCRFQPTCSAYAIEAIRKYGPGKGGWMSVKRIVSCHPWGKHGYDPVP